MGTNFFVRGYRRVGVDDMDPKYHIGKRSSAGRYCWDCGATLCKDGEAAIHFGKSEWYDACPKCGQKHVKEPLQASTAGRELGFNKTVPTRKSGVASCCSFLWAMSEDRLKEITEKKKISRAWRTAKTLEGKEPDKIIEDEYGTLYTREEFEQVLEECPVRYFHVGEYFS